MITKKILIVDDNASMRSVMRSLVEQHTEAVYECDNGRSAVAEYAIHTPDWVLMDIKMKDMDGITAARDILKHYPDARIVMVTSYGTAEYREAARQAGVRAYVLKENLIELLDILDKSEMSY